MKKRILMFVLAALMLISVTACSNGGSKDADSDLAYITDKGTLVVGITDWEPMNYKDDAGNWIGFDTELAEAVGEKLGVDVEFLEITWDNKTFELDSKSIDCAWNGMTLTDGVKAAMETTKPYMANSQVVIMKADVIDNYTTIESLADLTFACESGSAGEDALKENELNYTAVTSQANALLEVESGSVDACVIDSVMAGSMTGEGTSYADLAIGLALTSEEYGVGFRKGSDMAAKVDEIIAELVEDGTVARIADKYSLTGSLMIG